MAAMEIKLMIDPRTNKVIFAESSKEFVDFLIFLLSLPIGTAIKLLTSESMAGSIGNVYKSVTNLNETYLQPNIDKNVLLNPFVFSCVKDIPLSINASSIISCGKLYTCEKSNCKKGTTNVPNGASCPDCHGQMSKEIEFYGSHTLVTPRVTDKNLEGYVRREASYMISNDLSVNLISTKSILSMMKKFDVSELEERIVKIGNDEALELLKASLQSTTVLTDVFLKREMDPEDVQEWDSAVSEKTSEDVVCDELVLDDIAEVEEEVKDEAKELEGNREDDEMADAKEEINDEAKEVEEKRGDDELVELAEEEIKVEAWKVEERREDDEMAEAKEEIKDEAKVTVVDDESNEDLVEAIKENEEMNIGEKEPEADKPIDMKKNEKAKEREEGSKVLKKRPERKGSKVTIDEKVNNKKEEISKKKEEPKTVVGRQVHERKSVERLVAVIDTDSSKDLRIEKGRGTALKDIPNVAFKLSRRKCDDTCKLLHTILFGRRGKAPLINSNISRFSGFVWRNDEDKQKNKIKETLCKCNKGKLVEFCEILDIQVSKTHAKKEEVIVKLMEFLEAPHVTTSELLSEKEHPSKGKKRSSESKIAGSSLNASKTVKKSMEKGKSQTVKSCDTISIPKLSATKTAKRPRDSDFTSSTPNGSKKKKSEPVKEKDSAPKKPASKEITGTKNKSEEKEVFKPSDAQLKVALPDILKQIDFNTATFEDILQQLAKQFESDLTARKSSIKIMLQNELNRIADEEDLVSW